MEYFGAAGGDRFLISCGSLLGLKKEKKKGKKKIKKKKPFLIMKLKINAFKPWLQNAHCTFFCKKNPFHMCLVHECFPSAPPPITFNVGPDLVSFFNSPHSRCKQKKYSSGYCIPFCKHQPFFLFWWRRRDFVPRYMD